MPNNCTSGGETLLARAAVASDDTGSRDALSLSHSIFIKTRTRMMQWCSACKVYAQWWFYDCVRV